MDLSRRDWYVPEGVYTIDPVTTSSGNPRPKLRTPLSKMLIHYIGAGSFLGRTDDGAVLMEIERSARNPANPKPNEYNSGSGIGGRSCEYAGPWCAAHSSGATGGIRNNMVWWGHVVFLGHPEMPTEAQATKLINGILKSRRDLVAKGWLTADHEVWPHREAPGLKTGTPCPGPLADNAAWWARIVGPYDGVTTDPGADDSPARSAARAPEPTPTETPPAGDTTIVQDQEGWMAIARRVFDDAGRFNEIAALNGGPDRVLHPGDVINLPKR